MFDRMSAVAATLIALGIAFAGCGAHDASDPEYGAMFKKTTQDRIRGTEFWGSSTQKDCTPGAGGVCVPHQVSDSTN